MFVFSSIFQRRAFVLASGLGLALAAPPADAAGLFESLFGPPRTVYQPDRDPLLAPPPRAVTIHSRRAKDKARPGDQPRPAQAQGRPEVGPGPLGPFVNDPTLRAGDIVVTARKLMVFRGRVGQRHGDSEFVDARRAADLGAGARRDIEAIERANARGRSAELAPPSPPSTPARIAERQASGVRAD